MSEKFSSGTINPKQTNKLTNYTESPPTTTTTIAVTLSLTIIAPSDLSDVEGTTVQWLIVIKGTKPRYHNFEKIRIIKKWKFRTDITFEVLLIIIQNFNAVFEFLSSLCLRTIKKMCQEKIKIFKIWFQTEFS